MLSSWVLFRALIDVFTAYQGGTNPSVVIKQIDLDEQPRYLIINKILVMCASHHQNIINYIVKVQDLDGATCTDWYWSK